MSLRIKTILGIAVIEAILLVVLVTTVLNHMRSSSEQGLIQRASTAAALFATTTKDAVLSYDLASLESFSDEAMKNSGMVYARVLGPNGVLFAEAGDPVKLGQPFSPDMSLDEVKDSVFDSFAEIREGEVVYGRVELGISTTSIDNAIRDAEKLSATIAAIEMGLVALFSFVLGAYLTGQLKSLHRAARLIAQGKLDVEVPVKGKDEVAEVAVAFNRMVTNLSRSNSKRDEFERKLMELNKTLEERIERRTQKLQEKNTELSSAYDAIQKAQAQLLQSEKMASVGQLAAGVAHEINNPVGFVKSNLVTLKDYVAVYKHLLEKYTAYFASTTDNERAHLETEIDSILEKEDIEFVNEDITTLLDDSIEGTVRVRDIVQGLRDFSHVDNSELQLADINQCIKSTLKMANNETKYICEVKTDLQPLPDTLCNPGQLNQVFLNLVVNASQAIEDSGVITVVTRHQEGAIGVQISDNGMGIPQENIDKLFDPFFTTKPVGEGTGLGLAIAYGIVQDHGGKIDVKSKRGVGTRFTITLPVRRAPGAAAA